MMSQRIILALSLILAFTLGSWSYASTALIDVVTAGPAVPDELAGGNGDPCDTIPGDRPAQAGGMSMAMSPSGTIGDCCSKATGADPKACALMTACGFLCLGAAGFASSETLLYAGMLPAAPPAPEGSAVHPLMGSLPFRPPRI